MRPLYETREVAYTVLVPHVSTNARFLTTAANDITQAAVDKYFELKAKKTSEQSNDDILMDIKETLEADER